MFYSINVHHLTIVCLSSAVPTILDFRYVRTLTMHSCVLDREQSNTALQELYEMYTPHSLETHYFPYKVSLLCQ
jgi:hypothetical protein